ncbi:hypothetical protein FB446DRAFT_706371 [Lentinula raphanica]|nr:hypothetical protein FB446DRAFT_706371 [Lentinula raphanica]
MCLSTMSAISAIFASAMVCAFPVDNVRASAGSLQSSQGDQELYPRGCGSSRPSGAANDGGQGAETIALSSFHGDDLSSAHKDGRGHCYDDYQKTHPSQDTEGKALSSLHGGGPSSAHNGKGLLHSGKQRVEYIFRFSNINLPADSKKPHSDKFIQYIVQKSMTKAYKDLGEDNQEVEGIEVEMFTTQHYPLSLRDIMLEDQGFEVVIPNAPGYGPLTVEIQFPGDNSPRAYHISISQLKDEREIASVYWHMFYDDEITRARDEGRYHGL